jgi:hypothetical protein
LLQVLALGSKTFVTEREREREREKRERAATTEDATRQHVRDLTDTSCAAKNLFIYGIFPDSTNCRARGIEIVNENSDKHIFLSVLLLFFCLWLCLSLSLSTRFVREQRTTENLAKQTTAIDDAWTKLCCC